MGTLNRQGSPAVPDASESTRRPAWCVQSLRDLVRALGIGAPRRRDEADRAASERVAAHRVQQTRAAIAARAVHLRDRLGWENT